MSRSSFPFAADFSEMHRAVESAMPLCITGQVTAASGLSIEAAGLSLPVGSLCRIDSFGGRQTLAEVIGFNGERTLLMSLSATSGVSRGDRVENLAAGPMMRCCEQLQGRVIDGMGNAIDGKGALPMGQWRRVDGRGVACLDRTSIDKPIATSVRAIDAISTCGMGQRMGIFSGPGVGKSTLLSQIAKHTSADVSVVALIGERGREVQEFIQHNLGESGMKRCVMVVSTSDDAPLLRVRAARVACTVAEFFRDRGANVLLLLDSLTRLCHAQRQIGLAAREPPATKGFPPSVFALLPEIMERAGKTATGSITGFYTVLVEGDDFNEPIPDAVKGISDGHIWLSRALSNRGHFPAIDVLQSISRVRGSVATPEQVKQAVRVLTLHAAWRDIEDLVSIGAYVAGMNAEHDLAFQARKRIEMFLRQDSKSPTTLDQAFAQMGELMVWIEQLEKVIAAQAGKAAARATESGPAANGGAARPAAKPAAR